MSKIVLSNDDKLILKKVGEHIEIARKRRKLRAEDVYKAANISKGTYQRLVSGSPGTSLGVLISVLHTLSLENILLEIASPNTDTVGIELSNREISEKKRINKDSTDELDTNF